MRLRDESPNRLRSHAGLTLLEVVVALTILGVGIVGVLRAFSSSMMACKAAEMHSYAAGLAQQVASELERRPDLSSGRLSGGFAETGSDYTWEAELEPAGSGELLRAQITVFWQDGNRRRHLNMFTCVRPVVDVSEPASSGGSPREGPG